MSRDALSLNAMPRNAISVDVEDYFHPTEVQGGTPAGQWAAMPSRVDAATRRLLECFHRHGVRGTFFILGWVAEKHPKLVGDIAAAGHEIGCHSHMHQLVYSLNPESFEADTRLAMEAIEAACGVRPRIYRAPSYSITRESWWALDVLARLGFTMDSSIYPIVHDRYGIPGFSRFPAPVETPSGSILEIPVATVKLASGRVAPVGGGGYLRLLPYRYTAAGVRRINREDARPACLYLHPWEVDPDQPRLAGGLIARLRTYSGLGGMLGKLDRLFGEFDFGPIGEVYR